MTCETDRTIISGVNMTWGRQELTCINFTGATPAGLDGTSFRSDCPDADFSVTGTKKEFWFDVDNASVAPTPTAGYTLVEIDIATGDSAATIAGKAQAVINGETEYRSVVNTLNLEEITIENLFYGTPLDVVTDIDSGLTFTQVRSGIGGDIGLLSGEVTLETSVEVIDVLAQQFGSIPVSRVFNGVTATVSADLLEMDFANWKQLIGSFVGDTYTPGGGSEVVGYGSSKLYQSAITLGGRLNIHPVRLDAADKSRDITIWNTGAQPSSLNYAADAPQVQSCEFVSIVDRQRRAEVNVLVFGDYQQDFYA